MMLKHNITISYYNGYNIVLEYTSIIYYFYTRTPDKNYNVKDCD